MLKQGLEAFPGVRVMQGSGSAALIPVPPRNCRHLGTCFKYMSSPTDRTGLPQSIPLEQSQQPWDSQALTPAGPISGSTQQQHQPGSDVPLSHLS